MDNFDYKKYIKEGKLFENDVEENEMYFNFLAKLRDSGKTNMWGATPYLQQAFDLSKDEAKKILISWIESFNKSFNESIKGGAMNELDIMAQEAKDLKSFVKDAYKEFKTLNRNKSSLEWLVGIFNQTTKKPVVNERLGMEIIDIAKLALKSVPQLDIYIKSLENDINLNGTSGYEDFEMEDWGEDYSEFISDKMGS